MIRSMRRCPNLLALSTAVVLVGAAAAGRLTPAALYRALLTRPIPASSLPPGFSPPVGAEKDAASPNSKLHRSVGVVRVFLNGGQDGGVQYDAGAYYVVFPSRQEAIADYRAEPVAGRAGAPKSFPTPARVLRSSLPNGGMRYTGVEYVDGNVRVFAFVLSTGENRLPRDALARALGLGRFALEHLERVRSGG